MARTEFFHIERMEWLPEHLREEPIVRELSRTQVNTYEVRVIQEVSWRTDQKLVLLRHVGLNCEACREGLPQVTVTFPDGW